MFWGFLILVFILLFWYGITCDLWYALDSKSWIKVKGVVTENYMEKREWQDDPDFKVITKYRFKVRSYPIISDHIAYGLSRSFNSEASADKELDKYKIGDTVTVYYHPTKNTESVLEPGLGKRQLSAITLFIFLSTILLFVYANAQKI
jgi:hypothetical protein